MLHLPRAARAIELQARAQVVLDHGEQAIGGSITRGEVSLEDAKTLRRIADGLAVYEVLDGTAHKCEPPINWLSDWRFEVVRRCATGSGAPVAALKTAARARVEELTRRRVAVLDMLKTHVATLPLPVTMRTSPPPSEPLTRHDRARASMHGALSEGGWAARLSLALSDASTDELLAGAGVLDDDEEWAEAWNRTAASGVGGS